MSKAPAEPYFNASQFVEFVTGPKPIFIFTEHTPKKNAGHPFAGAPATSSIATQPRFQVPVRSSIEFVIVSSAIRTKGIMTQSPIQRDETTTLTRNKT
jgi:hypothetical protein